jgi:uracil-DNA glycosylase
MSDEKESRYKILVAKRKFCRSCQDIGMVNPSTIVEDGKCLDCEEIDAWALWQNSLDAEILLLGQEWGDVNGYIEDCQNVNSIRSDTNLNLIELFRSIGIEVKDPDSNEKNKQLFFTNAALCLKENGGAQGETTGEWYQNCSGFIKELIDIIEPKVVITLGFRAFNAIARSYNLNLPSYSKFSEIIDMTSNGIILKRTAVGRDIMLFPVYHPACRIINLGNKSIGQKYRSWSQMLADWKRIGKYISSNAVVEEIDPMFVPCKARLPLVK